MAEYTAPFVHGIAKENGYMLIDFHTHIFPDRIAPHAIESLKAGVKRCEGTDAKNYTDATYTGLLKSMEENGVFKSVVLPIVTNPKKPDAINDFAEGIRNERVISLASVHPMQDNVITALGDIKKRGFIGIKMHPEFQQCYIDGRESIEILKECERLGLLVVLHTGKDIGIEPPVHCTPERLFNALEYVSGKNIVAAHMGGWRMWDKAEKYLVGTNIYLDTAFVADYMDREQFLRMVKNHGSDKVLFGSDSPWETPSRTLEYIKSFSLTDADFDRITYKNALSLFNEFR